MSNLLYYGTPKEIEGDELAVSRYPQVKNGVSGEFLFATHRKDQAALYALGFPNLCHKFGLLTVIQGHETEGTLGVFSDLTAEQAKDVKSNGKLYGFPDTRFERVGANGALTREWVSPVPINLAKDVVEVETVQEPRDVMARGLQIFCRPAHIEPKMYENFAQGPDALNLLPERIASGQIDWLNRQQNVGIDPQLAAKVAAKMIPSQG